MIEEPKLVLHGACSNQIATRIANVTDSIENDKPPLLYSLNLNCEENNIFPSFCIKVFAPKQIKPFWYPTVSAFVLCFDFHSESSFKELQKNISKVSQHAPFTPLFLAVWDSAASQKRHYDAEKVCVSFITFL